MTAAVERGRDLGGIGLLWVAVLGAAQVASIALGAGPPLQPFLSIVFVLTCPGFLLLGLEQPKDLSARIVIAMGGSLALNIAIATVVLVGDARWIAPIVAVVLVGIAALPRRSLRSVAARLGVVGATARSRPLALPAGEPSPDLGGAGVAAADSGETQVGREVAFGEVPEVAALEVPVLDERVRVPTLIDVNTAGAETMMALPGVGPALAARIVAYRDEQGPYETFDDLLRVPGIGPSKLKGFPAVAQVTPRPPDVIVEDEVAPASLDPGATPSPEGLADTAEPVAVAATQEAAAPDPAAVGDADDEKPGGSGEAPGSEAVLDPPAVDAAASTETEPSVAAAAEQQPDPQLERDVADRKDENQPAGSTDEPEAEPAATTPPTGGDAAGDLVDVNSAGLEELMRLPGVGRDLASRILTARWTKGRFTSTADLKRVSGLGPRRLRDLAPLVTTGSSSADPDAESGEPAGSGGLDPDDAAASRPPSGPAESDGGLPQD